MKKLVIIGAGGHSKVIIDLIHLLNEYTIVGIYDDMKEGYFCNYKILGKIIDITKNITINNVVIAIGDCSIRKQLYNKYNKYNYPYLIHPNTIISSSIKKIGDGTIIMAGTIIQTEVDIGKLCILNTNSNIDHECKIGDFNNICPSVTICGQVNIGNINFIGASCVIIQNINIGNNCIVGAGSVIIRDINDNLKIIGNPGRIVL
jgi:sugar O-acyltransferase (sialic acid O-acetyltransferase NeuD family)